MGNDRKKTEATTQALMSSTFDLCSYMVAQRTGGQGKTLIAQLLYDAAKLAGWQPTLVSADSVNDGQSQARSKLSTILDGVIELAVAPPIADVMESGLNVVAHWDQLGAILEKGNALIDVGANVLPSVANWARVSQCADMKPLVLVVPVTCQAQSAADAVALITDLAEIADYFPVKKTVICFNDVHGRAETAAGPSFDELRRMIAKGDLVGCQIKKCVSEIWAYAEADKIRLSTLAAMAPEEYVSRYGVTKYAGSRGRQMLTAWRQESLAALADAIFPSSKAAAGGANDKRALAGGFGS